MSLLTSIAGLAARPVLAAAAPYLIGLSLATGTVYVGYQVHHQREIGRSEVRAEWNAERLKQQTQALAESEANAKESFRRIQRQQENQRAQDQELSAARRDAARNSDDAGRMREQLANTAHRWRDALDHSPTVEQCAAAGAAIAVQADVLGRWIALRSSLPPTPTPPERPASSASGITTR